MLYSKLKEKGKKGGNTVDPNELIQLAGVGLIIYFVGFGFTKGVRLFPRHRDNLGEVIEHPLHTVEAVVWPLSWIVWGGVWGFVCLGTFLVTIYLASQDIGRVAGRVKKPRSTTKVQDRLDRIKEHVPRNRQ